MNNQLRILILIFVVLVLIATNVFYVVSETKQVVITQLDKPIGKPITKAGLKFKLPIIQKANYFEKRVMKWDGNPNQIPTRDKKYIWVDTTARWRIVDPLQFLKRLGNMDTAMNRLDGIIDSVVRDHVSNNDLVELVRSEGWVGGEQPFSEVTGQGYQTPKLTEAERAESRLVKGREKITREMVENASHLVPEFGIELLDIRIKRINYVDSVQQKVFDRMISERKRISAQLRSEGEGERAAILGEMERELSKITSGAYREAQEIRGQADAEATKIYAEAFGKDPDFFQFYRTLDFYKAFSNPQSTFVMTNEADVFRYLKNSGVIRERGQAHLGANP